MLEYLLGEHPFPPSRHTNFMALYSVISSGKTPPPPEDTKPEVVAFVESCLRVEQGERPDVEGLLGGAWLSSCGDVRQPVLAWLMKAAAKKMAQQIAQM